MKQYLPQESFGSKLSKKAKQMLFQQKNPPAVLFFIIYCFQHLHWSNQQHIIYTLFGLGLVLSLLFSYNIFFIYSPLFSNTVLIFSVVNLAVGFMSSNQKWKLMLYVFILGNTLLQCNSKAFQVYSILGSIYIAQQIYRNFVCKTMKDNSHYFIGFFTIICFQACSLILKYTSGNTNICYFSIPFGLFFGYKIFSQRVRTFKQTKLQTIKDGNLIGHYIELIAQKLKSPFQIDEEFQRHKKSCTSIKCFCKSQAKAIQKGQYQKRGYALVRSMFQLQLKKQNKCKQFQLKNKFILLLIDNGEVAQAILIQNHLNTEGKVKFNYFDWFLNAKTIQKINQKIQQLDYFCPYTNQFAYAFQYDNSYLHLATEIKQILKQKVKFWTQVGKQFPSLNSLKTTGTKIVEDMYTLNQYYCEQIKVKQEKLNNFTSTILYSMYLLSTTNYKQMAETLIKTTSRRLQSIKINQQNMAQTYGIKISIKSQNVYQKQNQHKGNKDQLFNIEDERSQSQNKLAINEENQKNKQFYQIITNLSQSFCKSLGCAKHELIGKQLNRFIPSVYKQKHRQKMKKFLNLSNKYIYKPDWKVQFLKSQREIPFRTKTGKIISSKITIKLFNDPQQGLVFIGLIQNNNQNKVTVLADLNGNIYQHQEGLQKIQITNNKQLLQQIRQKKEEWQRQKTITTSKINFVFQQNNYLAVFSSPFQGSYLDNYLNIPFNEMQVQPLLTSSNQQTALPPLHIDFTNQSVPFMNNKKHQKNEQMTNCIKKIQSVFYKSDIDSQSSSGSRKSSVVNVLNTFSSNMFIPFYTTITIAFFLSIIVSLGLNLISFNTLNLPWDSQTQLKNPIINNLNILQMNSYLIRTMNYEMDINEYHSNPNLNSSIIFSYYGISQNYENYVYEEIDRLKILYRRALQQSQMYTADIYSESSQKARLTLIPTYNPKQPDTTKNIQYLSILNLLMNYATDLELLSQGKLFQNTILSLNYWSALSEALINVSSMEQTTNTVLSSLKAGSTLILTCFSIGICLLVIPLFCFLRKKVKKHLDIYDLIVSVESQQVIAQISKIQNIIVIVNTSGQTSEILKYNTVNYSARKRSSISKNAQGSNQLIQGLISSQTSGLKQTKDGKLNYNKIVFRKRSGDLNTQNSQADNKKLIINHWILYSMIIGCLAFLFSIQLQKIQYFNYLSAIQSKTIEQFSNKQRESLLLLNTKLYLRSVYPSASPYSSSTLQEWLNSNVYSLASMKYNNLFATDQQFKSCPSDHNYLFCEIPYSLSTLRYNAIQIIKQAYEQKHSLQISQNSNSGYYQPNSLSQNVSYNQHLTKFSQLLFYAQTMNDRLQNKTYEASQQLVQQMFKHSSHSLSYQNIAFIANIIYCLVCLIVGLIIIRFMKNQYLKQIIIVSFLNEEMIAKNKRVQSFLETLSKSSY